MDISQSWRHVSRVMGIQKMSAKVATTLIPRLPTSMLFYTQIPIQIVK